MVTRGCRPWSNSDVRTFRITDLSMFDAEDCDHGGCHVGVTLLLGFQGPWKNRHLQYTFIDFQHLHGPKVSKTLLKMESVQIKSGIVWKRKRWKSWLQTPGGSRWICNLPMGSERLFACNYKCFKAKINKGGWCPPQLQAMLGVWIFSAGFRDFTSRTSCCGVLRCGDFRCN